MTVSMASANNALKTLYLGVVSNQLNTSINPLLSKIQQTTADVWGKEVVKLAPYGLNGGVGSGTETGNLPIAYGNNYVKFTSTLKNLYGKLEISDKAIRASENSVGAFVNLLNSEMEGLLTASRVNMGRMLYGDGSGKLCTTTSAGMGNIPVSSVKYLTEGMAVDIYNEAGTILTEGSSPRIRTVNRKENKIIIDSTTPFTTNSSVYVQNSKNNDLTGLGAIFGSSGTIYGLTKSDYHFLTATIDSTSTEIDDCLMQSAIDKLDEIYDSTVDFIVCSSGVKRAYQKYLNTYRRNVDVMDLEGGYKAISYNGIPLISDRFCPDKTMYLLNMSEFALHQLCDWKWLESENGNVLRQNANSPTYSATLVKYAELVCDKIAGQAAFTNLSEA